MATATVRVAPVERWCEHYKPDIDFSAIKGMLVEIYPASLSKNKSISTWRNPCDGNWWSISDKSRKELADTLGIPVFFMGDSFCEHMLEMD